MNTTHMTGQRFIFGFDGLYFSDDLKHIIRDLNACGIILFKQNIQSPDQVANLCRQCQDYAAACGIAPLFICVDQEGGVVARFKEPFTVFKGNPFIETLEDAQHFAVTTAKELLPLGINMNLAPVLDVVPKGVDSIMKDRAFKGDATSVSKLGTQVISSLQSHHMMAVAKHFPGIGRTVKDSHFHLPVLDIDLDSLNHSDMIPFADAIKQDVTGIMLSHIHYPQLDETWQASLSPLIVNDILRNKMGFEGLIFTDDLDMKAIKQDMPVCIRQILRAGVDITLICHKGPNIDIAWSTMQELLTTDKSLYLSGKKSVERILKYKRKYLSNPVS